MRTIKFRAYDSENGMYPVELLHFNKDGIHAPYVTSVMQFTGLLDKNGVEIYEGDIITHNIYTKASGREGQSNPKPIFWDITKCGFETNKEGSYSAGMFYGEYTVIGNIYQNPELLK